MNELTLSQQYGKNGGSRIGREKARFIYIVANYMRTLDSLNVDTRGKKFIEQYTCVLVGSNIEEDETNLV